jgi:Protein of unknown function (DUF4230)
MTDSRPRRSFGTLLVTTVVVGGLLAVGLAVGMNLLKSPFRTVVVDRSAPPVLTSLQSIAEFRAARGTFEVVVDLEHDVRYLPSALAGKRVIFQGVGSVDAYVDFSALDESAITVNRTAKRVKIVVPAPALSDPTLDPTMSRVLDTDKGLLDRVSDLVSGDDGSEQDLYIAATEKMRDAAAAAGLQETAEVNTRQMLTALLTGLGYETIEIEFGPALVPE